jgi:peptide/nickel transport system substrate-binding protein
MKRLRHFLLALAVVSCLAPDAATAETNLRIGTQVLPDSRGNPYTNFGGALMMLWGTMFDTLTLIDDRTGNVSPQLAVAWEETGPTTWRVKLREGVVFSNGATLTAETIVAVTNFLKSPEAQAFRIALQFDGIDSARAIDPLTVEFTLKRPDPVFARLLSFFWVIEPGQLQKLGIAGFANAPIGTGPYVLAEWRNERAVFTRNPTSWQKAPTDKLEFITMADTTSRVKALVAGSLDAVIQMAPEDAQQVEAGGGRALEIPLASVTTLAFIQTRPENTPLKDSRVRQALNYAVNKEAIASIIMGGAATPSGQLASRGILGHDPSIAAYPHDPAKAKALLKEAGHENGFAFTLNLLVGGSMSELAAYQQVAADLAQVGVAMKLEPVAPPIYARNFVNGKWSAEAFVLTYNGELLWDGLWALRFSSCMNENGWFCDREIQPVIDAAFAAPTLEERERLTQQVMRRYHEQAYALYLFETVRISGIGRSVARFGLSHNRLRFDEIQMKQP